MAIQKLYDSLTPVGYFTLGTLLFFLLGLFFGWCIWWWTARRYSTSQAELKAIEEEANRVRRDNRLLAQDVKIAETKVVNDLAKRELSFASVSGPSLDWESLPGIDLGLAQQLKELNVQNVAQLEALSDEDRSVLEAKCKWRGLAWDWAWLRDWKSAEAGSATKLSETDWSKLEGVDSRVAEELNRMGIRDMAQLESLSQEDRELLEAKLSFDGNPWDWSSLAKWKTTAAGAVGAASLDGAAKAADVIGQTDVEGSSTSRLASEAVTTDNNPLRLSRRSTDVAVDWGKIDGVDPGLALELGSLGIQNVEQLEQLSEADRAKLEARLSSKGLSWDWGSLGKWKSAAAGVTATGAMALASTSTSEPPVASPATSKGGWSFGSALFGRESKEGSVRGLRSDDSQTDSFSHSDVQDATTVTGFASGLETASQHGDPGPPTQSLGEPSALQNANQLPVFATGIPEVKDDLTLLDGIDGPQAVELHRMGIHNFDQLHNLSADDRMRLQNLFRQRGWYLDMDQWRIASEGNTENPSIEDIQRKAFEIFQFRDRQGLGGGERTDWEQAEWELRGNPSFGYGVPHDIDDFAVSVTGVTAEARDELYRMGLYNFGQVNELGHDSRRLLTRWFAGPRFGVDLTMAFAWLSSLESVPQDKNYGNVYANRPASVDDLSDINGVGPSTERDLNRIGIYQYSQIASWTDENIQAIAETLQLENRIQDDLWVVQAERMTD